MTIARLDRFKKDYTRLPAYIQKKVHRQLQHLLAEGITHPGINVRKMVNEEDIWEMRVDLHYRITFQIQGDVIQLRRIGTHEIYRKP
jgi:mRNA-degrading endonuclease RelE of RelBE toxin-antitoxin system